LNLRGVEVGLNIEIKAHCQNLEIVKKKLQALPVESAGVDRQTDTFFMTPKGRLKLRQSSLYGNLLIPYLRADQQGPKQSQYVLIELSDADRVNSLLTEILGVRLVVSKIREIYLYENVRIHLDQVDHLGDFIELEAAIEDELQLSENYKKVDYLMKALGIRKNDLIDSAYVDLLEDLNRQGF